MKLIRVNCNGCGAPLDAGEDTRFVTCSFCHTRLEIVRSASAVYTRALEKLQEQTERIAENLEVIRLQNELEQLDREWAEERRRYLVTDKHGRVEEPSGNPAGAIVGVVAGIFFAVFSASLLSGASSGPGPGGLFAIFPLAGIGIAIVSLISYFSGTTKAAALRGAEAAHQQRRAAILARMASARPPDSAA